jgi:hypothetical protein
MGILIGMDEAGYGPHLGPLVVAATAWEVSDEPVGSERDGECKQTKRRPAAKSGEAVCVAAPPRRVRPNQIADGAVDLYRRLAGLVAKSASDRRVAIADSKVLYTPGAGLRQLERGLHAVLRTMQQTLACWKELINYCGADPDGHHMRVCWPEGCNHLLPVDATDDELTRLTVRFARACDGNGVRPLLIRARLVFPAEFNELTSYYNSKGAALSHVTVGLLREVVNMVRGRACGEHGRADATARPMHGGRNYYTALLQHHFSEYWIAPVFESHAESHYEWGQPESRMRVVFRVNGERFLPTALASMTAKYLRELSMRAFNEFWQSHVPELRHTAGYYRDAWRFKKEIAAKQRELGIEEHLIWRNR